MAKSNYPKHDMLVCVLKYRIDMSILKDQLWYRIPVKSAPENLNEFKFLSFYQTKIFENENWMIKYYGPIKSITTLKRKQLFPHEPRNEKSEEKYHKIELYELLTLQKPIVSKRWRLIVFIRTTFDKFKRAEEINDLFHDSPLEDKLWKEIKKNQLVAERQFFQARGRKKYFLDFAMFCQRRKLDIECDGKSHRSTNELIMRDQNRDKDLTKLGWEILRYDSGKLRDVSLCVNEISETANRYGGLATDIIDENIQT